jgi:glycogen phosphorylase
VRHALAGQVARRGGDPAWTAGALDADALTIVFARRFATYKRATLLLSDPSRLSRLLRATARSSSSSPARRIRAMFPARSSSAASSSSPARREHRARLMFLEDYDVALARTLVEGADVWLNVPRRPYEASGTSGMKAAANGALNLSISDGWWAEAWEEHNELDAPIGWSIEAGHHDGMHEESLPDGTFGARDLADAEVLFDLLESEVVPLFYQRGHDGLPDSWLRRVRSSIRHLAPFFNTHRMVGQYTEELYLPAHWERIPEPALEAAAAGD